ncbi:MAG: sigma-E factor negative regulatory protein [Woeseiaceae bacterium]
MNEAIRMQVSAFVDGELPENEAELLVRRLSQDAVLRQQVAEYLAIGRIMRGEYSAQGSDVLRERIAAELDERPLQDDAETVTSEQSARYVRPLAGFAIAASVALVAIFGLRQVVDDDGVETAIVAEDIVSETVPAMNDEELRALYLRHTENSNTINARLTAAQILEDELVEEPAEDEVVDEEAESAEEADEIEPVTSQQ